MALAVVHAQRVALEAARRARSPAPWPNPGRRRAARWRAWVARLSDGVTCRACRPTGPCEAAVGSAPAAGRPESIPPARSAILACSSAKTISGIARTSRAPAGTPCSSHSPRGSRSRISVGRAASATRKFSIRLRADFARARVFTSTTRETRAPPRDIQRAAGLQRHLEAGVAQSLEQLQAIRLRQGLAARHADMLRAVAATFSTMSSSRANPRRGMRTRYRSTGSAADIRSAVRTPSDSRPRQPRPATNERSR